MAFSGVQANFDGKISLLANTWKAISTVGPYKYINLNMQYKPWYK